MNELYTGFENAADITWSSISQLKALGETLHCLDGRRHPSIVSAPGGALGETLLVLAAAESIHQQKYRPRFLRWYLHRLSEVLGKFYLHTDPQTLSNLHTAVSADPRLAGWASLYADNESFFAALKYPPASLQSALLEYLVKPDYVGCEYLRMILGQPEKSRTVRTSLVEDTLASFYILLWGQHPDMVLELHAEQHEQAAFVIINSTHQIGEQTPVPYCCHHAETELFISHEPVRQLFQHHCVAILTELETAFGRAPLEEALLQDSIHSLDKRQLAQVRERMAAHLPVVQFQMEDGSLTAESAELKPHALG